jgi:hypothetical protein
VEPVVTMEDMLMDQANQQPNQKQLKLNKMLSLSTLNSLKHTSPKPSGTLTSKESLLTARPTRMFLLARMISLIKTSFTILEPTLENHASH